MTGKQLFLNLVKPYTLRWLIFALLNFFAIAFFIISLFLIEPIVKLLFQGNMNDCSVVSTYFIEQVSALFSFDNSQTMMAWMTVCVILFLLLKNVLNLIGFVVVAPAKSNVIKELRNQIYHKILRLPLSFYSTEKRGNIISVATNDAQEVEFTILKSFQQFLIDPVTTLVYLMILFMIDYQLTLFVLIFLPLSGLVISTVSRKLRKKGKNAKEILGDTFAFIEETISGLRVIKSFSSERIFNKKFDEKNKRYAKLQTNIHRHVDLASPLSEVLGVIVVMIILVYGGFQILQSDSHLSAPLFIVYMTIFVQVINPLKNSAAAFTNFRRGMSALDRIVDILNRDEVILEAENPISISTLHCKIEYQNVNFGYSKAISILENINLTIEKGKTYAIVGESGSGKSTMIDLLPRFYDVTSGNILIDGISIKDYSINQLRSLYAIVSQEVVLFHDTIRNNITYGLKNVSDDAVREAARHAFALEFIEKLPDQFETIVGDRGALLSGGEKQRISLARAFLRDAPIFILDEATSALDIESEIAIQKALHYIENKTVIIVAHRPTTIKNADVVITVENKQIQIHENNEK